MSTNIVARNQLRLADPAFGVDAVSEPTGLHYSWTRNVSAACRVHFVHLNLFPGFTCGSASNPTGEGPRGGPITCKSGDIAWPENSLGFLRDDLAAHAAGPGVLVVTLQHYGFDGFSNGWYNADQREAMWAVLGGYRTLVALVGHTHTAEMYSFNGSAQAAWAAGAPGFIDVVNAPATQKEDGKRNALPSEFMTLEVALDAGSESAGTLRVAQRVGSAWGKVLGSKRFEC